MKRPWQVWCTFVVCLAIAVTGMGWLSYRVVELERAEAQRNFQADFEGNVRLALRRIDLVMSQLLAEQNAWPYLAYESTYRPPSTGNRQAPVVASPLRMPTSPLVKIFFQLTPSPLFQVRSPAVPQEITGAAAAASNVAPELAARNRLLLARLAQMIDGQRLLDELPPPRPVITESLVWAMPGPDASNALSSPQQLTNGLSLNLSNRNSVQQNGGQQNGGQQPELQQSAQQEAAPNAIPQQPAYVDQTVRNLNEYSARVKGYQNQVDNFALQIQQREQFNQAAPQASARDFPPTLEPLWQVAEGLSRPVWVGQELLVARQVMIGDRVTVQGCWLDWPALKQMLAAEVSDLLPTIDIVPVIDETQADPGRMLATFKAQLIATPPVFRGFSSAEMSPVRLALLAAWIGLALTAMAAALLLRGVLNLSERRARFVSAVTHELRTPLTTFRLYTEMLAEGMVTDESQRRHYLSTLKLEAERLFHLIENVLSYARLERGRTTARTAVTVEQMLRPVVPRLSERAQRAEMQLVLDMPEAVGDVELVTDPAGVEQVLVNLFDNACKYAASAKDRRIHLNVAVLADALRISVRDHGPGIAASDTRRLFRPFTKSVREAAQTAPGVGLGLALSRGIAHDLGGTLVVEQNRDADPSAGATLVLTLPLSTR